MTSLQVTELAGYTSRVSEMLDVFEDVNRGIYRRSADRDQDLEAGGRTTAGGGGASAGGGGASAGRGGAAVVQHGQRVCCLLEMRGESRTSPETLELLKMLQLLLLAERWNC